MEVRNNFRWNRVIATLLKVGGFRWNIFQLFHPGFSPEGVSQLNVKEGVNKYELSGKRIISSRYI